MLNSSFRILLMIAVLLVSGCKSSTIGINSQERLDDLDRIAKNELGERFARFPNSTNEFMLYTQKNKSLKDLFANVSYLVLEVATGTVLIQDEMIAGGVKWESEYLIRAIGRVPNTTLKKKIVYFFDVKKRKKLK